MNKEEIKKALKAIADGYDYEIVSYSDDYYYYGSYSHFVQVDNPDYTEDDGSDRYLIIELK